MITRREFGWAQRLVLRRWSPERGRQRHRTARGVTANSVKVGVLGSLTGVQAVFGQGNISGAEIVFDEVNAAGGIHGRRIEIVSVDDESTPARSIAGFRRLVDDERVFAVFGPSSSAIGQAMEPTLRAATSVPVFISIFPRRPRPNPSRPTSSAPVR
jgi:branched-chain amino acid transport system substrate-binding protein